MVICKYDDVNDSKLQGSKTENKLFLFLKIIIILNSNSLFWKKK